MSSPLTFAFARLPLLAIGQIQTPVPECANLIPFGPNPTQCGDPMPVGPCGPGNEQCGPKFGHCAPQFHVMDESCGLNDPNAPMYDPVHGVYHLFYQKHIGIPGGNVVWGHVASRDLVYWAHLPVALWNDQPYDRHAVWTGSATIVDGQNVIVYPGTCSATDWAGCTTGFTIALAKASNSSDPLAKNWTKMGVIVNASGKDPSAAWRTDADEWRFLSTAAQGGHDWDNVVYGSMDFQHWYEIGPQPGWGGGDCQSLFPLPKQTPSSGQAAPLAMQPTHVYHQSGGWMTLGVYTDGAPGEVGSWTALPDETHTKIDDGQYYAAKDFWDPVKSRRILWGWAIPEEQPGAQSLPRELTWNPDLQQIVASPLDEQASLRSTALVELENRTLEANRALQLGPWEPGVGNQTEVDAVFDLPDHDAVFGLVVMGDADPSSSGTYFFVDYKHDAPVKASSVPYRTLTVGSVSNRTGIPKYHNHTTPGLRMAVNENTVTIRIFVDNTFAEGYWNGGRAVITAATQPTREASIAVLASAEVSVRHLSAWRMKSIWVPPDALVPGHSQSEFESLVV